MSAAKGVIAAAMAAGFLVGPGVWAAARAPAGQASPSREETQVGGVPQTADEHVARAAWYRDKAASYRKEAELHRKMFVVYDKKEGNPVLQSKSGRELPWIARMRKHCDSYMKEAERMAAEADGFAEFHRMRAVELRGK